MITKLLIFLVTIAKCTSESQICPQTSIDITQGKQLQTGDIIYKGITYNPTEYYKQANSTRGCVCMKKKCIHKCCPIGYGLRSQGKNKTCVIHDKEFDLNTIPFYRDGTKDPDVSINGFTIVPTDNVNNEMNENNPLNCDSRGKTRFKASLISNDEKLKLDTDGNVYLVDREDKVHVFLVEDYCVDNMITASKVNNTSVLNSKLDGLVCIDAAPVAEIRHNIIGMSISCFFILLTLVVYGVIPELRNMHGRVLCCYLFCLLLAFLHVIVMQVLMVYGAATEYFCYYFGFTTYFFWMTAFFWMNVMCFDIFWTFCGSKCIWFKSSGTRFKTYCAYAFGFPVVLTLFVAVMQFSPLIPDSAVKPGIFVNTCGLDNKPRMLYLYIPMLILLIANTVYFTTTVFKIVQITRQTEKTFKSSDSSRHDSRSKDRQRVWLYLKLFIVMGLLWVLEIFEEYFSELKLFWMVVDVLNGLIGLYIFVLFVLKKKTLKHLRKRWQVCVKGAQHGRTAKTGSSATKSSSTTHTASEDVSLHSLNTSPHQAQPAPP